MGGDADQQRNDRSDREELEPTAVEHPIFGQGAIGDGASQRNQKERPIGARNRHR